MTLLPVQAPETLGFDPARLGRVERLLQQAIDQGAFPGALCLVGRRGQVAARYVLGHAQVVPKPRPLAAESIFDIASLTKVVAGTSLALLLIEEGIVGLDDAPGRFLPELCASGKAGLTVRQLLAHTAGFPAWSPLYLRARDPDEALRALCAVELEAAPGARVLYSDLGMILLGLLARRVLGEPIERYLARRVFGPLGMVDTGYGPVGARERCVATEQGNRHEAQMIKALGKVVPGDLRGEVLCGEVHDGNAHYALRGVSAHAGLFSTADDLFRFAQLYLGGGPAVISRAALAEAVACHSGELSPPRGLGWQLFRRGAPPAVPPPSAHPPAPPPSLASFPPQRPYGDLLTDGSFGHTGFTGCSLAIDAARELVIILLTNRVHPDAARVAIGHVRPRLHNLVAASLSLNDPSLST